MNHAEGAGGDDEKDIERTHPVGDVQIVADPQMPLLGNQRDRISKTELDICQLGITDEFIAGMQIAAGISIPILAIIIWLRRRFCRQCLMLRFESRDL